MGFGSFIHRISTTLLLVATALLIVVSVSAPAVNSLALLKVEFVRGIRASEVTFGSFRFCFRDALEADECSRTHVGYNPAAIIFDIDGTYFSRAAEHTFRDLTRAMVLHPIAAALCFIAFMLCLGTGIVGSLAAVFFALLSFIITIVAMACDFAAFSIIRDRVNDHGRSYVNWSSGIWCILAAAICTLFASALVTLTCCADRTKKRHQETRSK